MRKILIIIVIIIFSNQLFSQNYKFGKVSKEELEEEYYPLDSSANAAILYKKRKTYFKYIQGEGFKVVTEVFERRKIYNSEAFDSATKKTIEFYNSSKVRENISGLKATTYNLKGNKIVKTNLNKNEIFEKENNKYWSEKKFTMPNIKEGSVIEWKYIITSPFKSINDVQFQYNIPVKKMKAIIDVPEYYIYNRKSKGFYPIQMTSDKVMRQMILNKKKPRDDYAFVPTTFSQKKLNYSVHIDYYEVNNVPALVEEAYVNNIKNYQTAIEYEHSETHWPGDPIRYFSNSWTEVTKTIFNSSNFRNQLSKSKHFKDELATVVGDNKTDLEKVVAIFEFVKNKIKWNRINGIRTYHGTRKAFKEGVGNVADINYNLVSMLNYSGLKADPVILSTRSHGIPLFPTIDGFNYVIAAVELENGIMLLDATESYSTPNVLPLRDLNWTGRLIRKDGTSTALSLLPKTPSKSDCSITLSLTEDGEMNGMIRNTYTNLIALAYRGKYAKVKDEDIVENVEENIGSIEIGDFRIINKRKQYMPVVEMFKFFSEDLVDITGDKMYLKPLLFKSKLINPFKLDKREFPIDFGSPISELNKVNITIPEGYQVEFVPENLAISLSNDYGFYRFKIDTNGKQLSIMSKLEINTAVLPSLNYNEIKEFYKMIVTKNMEQIILKKNKL